ncbi:MAG: isochorismatase family protein [Planctomycetota bacterium]|jgi:nicotinamidase-related amidase
MPIPRLLPDETALLVIDVQDKLVATIPDRERLITNCTILMRMAGELGVPTLVTEHYPTGLGRTVGPVNTAMIDPAARIEKTKFSALVDVVDEHLIAWRRPSVLLCGLEANVCVLQTALDLQVTGRQSFVVLDAVAASQPDQIAPAARRWEAAGAITTGVMSAMYELLADAQHPARRACVELAKGIER